MSKNNPPKDTGLFGNPFDLNGDGKTDSFEAAMMCITINEVLNKNKPVAAQRTMDLDDMDLDDRTIDLDDMNIKGI